MHRCAEWTEDADAPVADLIPEPLNDDGAIVGDCTRCLDLLGDVLHEVAGSKRVELIVLHQPLLRGLVVEFVNLADEGTKCSAKFERPSRTVAVPERHLAWLTRRRGDGDAFKRDVFDSPRGGPEHEGLAGPRLIDHLLVEFADPCSVREEHAEEPAVGNRAA